MKLPRREQDPARRLLDDGRRARAMSWVMGVMLFLTVLAAALGLATRRTALGIDRQLGAKLVVQVTGTNQADGEARAARVVAAVGALPVVRTASAVPRDEMARLLEPWLGDAGLEADLPIPQMVDVELIEASDTAVAAVTRAAEAASPGARVDRSASWLAGVRSFVLSLAWLAGGLVLLMASATAAIVLLTARAGLDTHRDTIDMLHMLGSSDQQVAALFQRRIGLDTLTGGVPGTLIALAVVALIGWRVTALESGLTQGTSLAWPDWIVLGALPLVFAGMAIVAARIAVLGTLKRRL